MQEAPAAMLLQAAPGYTVLVHDANAACGAAPPCSALSIGGAAAHSSTLQAGGCAANVGHMHKDPQPHPLETGLTVNQGCIPLYDILHCKVVHDPSPYPLP